MPTIKPIAIVGRVRRAINPPKGKGVKGSNPLTKHFVPLDTKALSGLLNRHADFEEDGLNLKAEDTEDARLVRDLDSAVRNWYEQNGWTVK